MSSIARQESLSEATNAASLRQWQAVLGPDEWGRAWEAMAKGEPRMVRCDACGRAADLEEMVQGRDCTLFCGACKDARTDGGWPAPEEFFEEGGDR